ncbi:F0F1 ATP synthase subunit I [Yersinia massiliensis]|jgi:ATP synthase protein I|uniref:F0F1 ATP synthase subunit I n=2 Tax=Yersinia TaxID=629 RepID=A0A2R4NVW0_9GAMM|nr:MULTISPECIES: F0F1 ATP synthase subunit I [Yersinia]HEC1648305.1 F0F1 ATP synthase subunit I [Yersinia enterocolitica]ATM88026.1 F0F1 ATP synthase subunit I [Yersinia frederiksenii]AVX40233.1 F0F1 ATP synthase subunit I [Yersinia massiliensis]MCB5318677.1 F0F1 ATP synthase subunit I [Yersinia massiliensis]MDA5550043.1 F0F1 ATP synthase subunit I [Yersinia massiliensis]
MPVSLYSGKIARKLLLLQLMTFVVLSAAFGLKSLEWSVSALAGGLAAWLPNAVFMLFASRHQAKTAAPGRVAWSFAIGEGLKVIVTIILLIVALGLLKAAFVPLGLTYLAVLIVQILAPAVISGYRT